MKHIIRFCLAVFLITTLFSCAEDGIDGAPGPAGKDGKNAESNYLFEYEKVSFKKEFDYQYTLGFPENFNLINSDKVLVYFQWEYIQDEALDIWRPLPQTVFKKDGTLMYNYDFTKNDVRLFLEANFPMDSLTSDDTDNWIVRAVVVPSQFTTREATSVDYSNYNEVIQHYGLENTEPTLLFGKNQ